MASFQRSSGIFTAGRAMRASLWILRIVLISSIVKTPLPCVTE
jgi:hypothetical protein